MGFDFVEKVMCVGSGSTSPTFQFYKKGFNLGGGSQPSWQDIVLSGNGSLSLTAALANGLNYLKLFGGTEQRNIPSGYTQVEYLESSGTQYIDTGIVLNSKATITTVGQFVSITSPTPITIWGFMGNSNMPRWGCSAYNNMWLMDLNFTTSQGTANTNKHTFVNETNGTTTYNSYVDGVSIYSDPLSIANPTSYTSNVLSAYIFARNNSNTAGNFSSSRIYSFNIVQNDVEVINLIPCRRNSDNVLGMYDTVTGNFLTNAGTGTFTAGNDVVPSPDTPVDIVCNNGVLKYGQYGKNLFDVNNVEIQESTAISADGSLVTNSSVNTCLTFIPVKPNTTYTISGDILGTNTSFFRLAQYKADKTFISRSEDSTGQRSSYTFTTSANTYYIRFHYVKSASLNTYQLEQGSIATTYEPYHFGIHTDGTTETVEVIGKNLFDQSVFNTDVGTTITYEWLQIPNGTYTMSTNFPPKTSTQYTNVWVLSGKQTGGADSTANGVSLGYPKTITVTDGWYTIAYRSTVSDIQRNPKDYNWQLEAGSTATAYEPYTVLGTATAENLFAIGNNYKDVQEVLAGSVTRNVGIKVLDGTEDWVNLSGTLYVSLLKTAINMIGDTNAICLMTSLKQVLHADINTSTNCFSVGANYLNCKLSSATYVSQFKQWLADQYANGTPVILVYPLATATTETVTAQPLSIQAGNNTISITQSSIDNLGLEVSYKATV